MAQIKTIAYDSWDRFKTDLYSDLFGCREFKDCRYAFRGQSDANWALASSFDRWFDANGKDPAQRISVASMLVTEFVTICEEQGYSLGSGVEGPIALSLAQHYGVPTRLLDWTDSPYIAAYFAFGNRMTLSLSRDHESVAIWALDMSAPIWGHELGVEILRAPRVTNVRLRNQLGLFTIMRTTTPTLEEHVKSSRWDGVALKKIVIPAHITREAISDLAAMGVTPGRLYHDYEGAAAAAVQRVMLRLA